MNNRQKVFLVDSSEVYASHFTVALCTRCTQFSTILKDLLIVPNCKQQPYIDCNCSWIFLTSIGMFASRFLGYPIPQNNTYSVFTTWIRSLFLRMYRDNKRLSSALFFFFLFFFISRWHGKYFGFGLEQCCSYK